MIGCVTAEGQALSNAAAVKAAAPPGRGLHADFQGNLPPAHLASLRQTGHGAAPGSTYHEGAAAIADVQVIDASAAAGERNLAQFGLRRPSGDPAVFAGQPEHTAPTGVGAEFRRNAVRQGYVPALYGVTPHGGLGGAR